MIICGDAITELRKLPDESVNCCITSPPYYGLRDYGTAKWEGGDPECAHEPTREWTDHKNANSTLGGGTATQSASAKTMWYKKDGSCPSCDAHRVDAQIGLEKTPEEYVQNLVAVFREVRRVLRKDGTLWLNLGDSYNGGGSAGSEKAFKGKQGTHKGGMRVGLPTTAPGLKPKDLIGIPWRVAFALQSDGWWLRQDIIWHKPNPMPESVTDRCTKAHEYVFMLSKSARYHYDAEAIKEPFADDRMGNPNGGGQYAKNCPYPNAHESQQSGLAKGRWNENGEHNGRNRRSVWTITTKPFREAHFATFPPDLVEPMIKAGCPVGGTVLDPFFGAGTTGLVAMKLGRDFIGIELNPKYCEMARVRIYGDLCVPST